MTSIDRRDRNTAGPTVLIKSPEGDLSQHWVPTIGGAVAGAKVASLLAEKGINVPVFEQAATPDGKVGGGLPFWHKKQRDDERLAIAEQLSHPRIQYVPMTRIGTDIPFGTLQELGSAVVIATGAEKDRPSPIGGIEAFKNRGFYYQNDYIQSMNHHAEDTNNIQPDGTVNWTTFPTENNAVIQGGGLASIDVAKAIMYIRTAQKLQARGISVDVVEMDEIGIPAILQRHDFTNIQELDIEPCTLLYHREKEVMPLDSQRRWKVSQMLLKKAQDKALFAFEDNLAVNGFQSDNRGISQITLSNGDVRDTRMFVSSIGSIIRPIEGLPLEPKRKETYALTQEEGDRRNIGFQDPQLKHVFVAGNASTGEGNIVKSRSHAKKVTDLVSVYLRIGDVDPIVEVLRGQQPPTARQQEEMRNVVEKRQIEVGYTGDLKKWLKEQGRGQTVYTRIQA